MAIMVVTILTPFILSYPIVQSQSIMFIYGEAVLIKSNFKIYYKAAQCFKDRPATVKPLPGIGSRSDWLHSGRSVFKLSIKTYALLPLDSSRWLRREVVAYAVDVRNFCEDAVGDLEEDRPVDLLDCCCHCVDCVDGADDDRPVI